MLRPETTLANDQNFGMTHAPGAGSIAVQHAITVLRLPPTHCTTNRPIHTLTAMAMYKWFTATSFLSAHKDASIDTPIHTGRNHQ